MFQKQKKLHIADRDLRDDAIAADAVSKRTVRFFPVGSWNTSGINNERDEMRIKEPTSH